MTKQIEASLTELFTQLHTRYTDTFGFLRTLRLGIDWCYDEATDLEDLSSEALEEQ